MSARSVDIHYRRLPDRLQVFRQPVLEDAGEYVVTLAEAVPLERPVRAGNRVVLEPGASVVWFTYPGLWHDLGRFHLADGTFTGVYANILTPVRMEAHRWDTTDLCLDVWMGADGQVMVLDEEELAAAEERGWVDPATAATARRHARELEDAARLGRWPPEHVARWDLERARARMRELREKSRA